MGCSTSSMQGYDALALVSDGRSTRDIATDSEGGLWVPTEPVKTMERVEAELLRHAIVLWVFLPAAILAELFIVEPPCQKGYLIWTLLLVLLTEMHHLYAEQQAWTALKHLIAPKEMLVLRQLGVLAKRRWLVLQGILQDADLYTDLTFPFIAAACDNDSITELWSKSWNEVPTVGPFIAKLVLHLRFWGVALICGVLTVSMSWVSLCLRGSERRMKIAAHAEQYRKPEGPFRIKGDLFLGWAHAAETAMIPSVAALSEELAVQERWRIPGQRNILGATKAREDYEYGKVSLEDINKSQIHDWDYEEKNEAETRNHFFRILLQKVVLGNLLSLWLQSAFLVLLLRERMGVSDVKIFVSMILSAIQAVLRCKKVCVQLGLFGLFVSSFLMLFVAWSFFKVYKAYQCKESGWELSGCDPIPF